LLAGQVVFLFFLFGGLIVKDLPKIGLEVVQLGKETVLL
jgi:hypothetical protein